MSHTAKVIYKAKTHTGGRENGASAARMAIWTSSLARPEGSRRDWTRPRYVWLLLQGRGHPASANPVAFQKIPERVRILEGGF